MGVALRPWHRASSSHELDVLQLGDDDVMGAADRPSQRRRQSANPPPVQEAAILALLKDIDDDTHPGDARHHELWCHQCTSRAYAKLQQNLIVGRSLPRLPMSSWVTKSDIYTHKRGHARVAAYAQRRLC